jgi:hypothetical protein
MALKSGDYSRVPVFTRGQFAEIYESLDRLHEDEAADLLTALHHLKFRFDVDEEIAREIWAKWSVSIGLGSIDDRVAEAFEQFV